MIILSLEPVISADLSTWPTNYTAGGFLSSDYRKPFAYDIRLSYRYFDADHRNNTNDGNRNRLIIENSITGRFIFNAIMGINLRVRHYWDKVRYQEFGRLDDDGYVAVTPYKGLNAKDEPIFDRNVNIFNIDLQYNWRFALEVMLSLCGKIRYSTPTNNMKGIIWPIWVDYLILYKRIIFLSAFCIFWIICICFPGKMFENTQILPSSYY